MRFSQLLANFEPASGQVLHASSNILILVGKRFAHQRFADSRESIRSECTNRFTEKIPIFEALGQIRANHVFSLIRIEIRVIRAHTSLLSHFLEGRFDMRANRPTKILILHVVTNTRGDASESWLSQVMLYNLKVDAWLRNTSL